MKTLITFLFALILSIASYSQIPGNIPPYIQQIFYFDPTNPNPGDGTIGNPWNSVESIPSVHMPGTSWVTPKSAILFKRGTVMFGNNPRTTEWHFTADSLYFGSYGTGPMAKLLFNSRNRSFRIFGTETRISHLHVANLDTMNYSQVVSLRVQNTSGPRGRMHIDSLIISQGFRGLNFSTFAYAYIENSLIYNINHDGVYSHSCDTIHFNRVHIHTVNKDWAWNRSESQSGGDAIQVEGTSSDRIRLVIVENSILDKSKYGNKFNLIVNGTDSTIVRNTKFYGHPFSTKGIYGTNILVDQCEFYGFDRAIWNTASTPVRVYNSVFVGFGHDATFEGNATQTYLLHGAYMDVYNCVFAHTNTVFRYPPRNINVRNSIFYNIKDVWWLGVRDLHGSGNIHWNLNGSTPLGLARYKSTNDYIIADPQFINPNINWIETVMIPGTGNGAWSYRTLENIPDFRVMSTSPAINNADPRVYDPLAVFVYGENVNNDPVYTRPFIETYRIEQDLAGVLRPQGSNNDIGAYEWYDGQPEQPVTQSVKPRVIVSSDISSTEPDDRQSFIRYLLYSNEFDTEGIIGSNSVFGPTRGDTTYFITLINAYANVRSNLLYYKADYPTAEELISVVREGQRTTVGMAAVGTGNNTSGSDWIISRLEHNDPRPLWVLLWGGGNSLAQALWDIKYNKGYTENQINFLVSKLRVYDIAGQDDAGAWINKTFPSIFYIRSANQFSGFAQGHIAAAQGGDLSIANDSWFSNNIRNQGTFGALYPNRVYMYEGDTPSFLHIIPNSLSDPEKPHYGSWGGRFTQNKVLNPARYTSGNVNEVPYRDFYMHDDNIDNWTFNSTVYNNKYSPLYRWRNGYQWDFAGRMKWALSANANRNPVAVVNGTHSKLPRYINVSPGQSFILDGSESYDLDGNTLTHNFWHYREPGTYAGNVTIQNSGTSNATVIIPSDSDQTSFHVIYEVVDNGSPTLTSYQRIVFNVSGEDISDQVFQSIINEFIAYTTPELLFPIALYTAIGTLNEFFQIAAINQDVLRRAINHSFNTEAMWNNAEISQLNVNQRAMITRNLYNTNNEILFANLEALKNIVGNVPGYSLLERNVLINPSPQQLLQSFRHNLNIVNQNINALFNAINNGN
jgi:hypothetical protein